MGSRHEIEYTFKQIEDIRKLLAAAQKRAQSDQTVIHASRLRIAETKRFLAELEEREKDKPGRFT